MNIGIEAQRIFRSNKHGMDYVILEELRCLQTIDDNNNYYVFVAPGPDRCLIETSKMKIIEVRSALYPIWEQVALPLAIKKFSLDILHCTSNTAPICCKIPLVLTLHDIIFLEPRDGANKSLYQNMGWYYRKYVVPRIIQKCKAIITVSDFERSNIIKKYPFLAERVVRVYNGYNKWFKPIPASLSETTPFFFFGNTDPKKNTKRTIQAYGLYLERSKIKRSLLLADLPTKYLTKILNELHLEHIKSHIRQSGYISNSQLPQIYCNSFAFLYTSLRESFGIPLLEAMACGIPVICSNVSSIPEIGGDYPLMVNPENVEDMANMMLDLEEGKYDLKQIRDTGFERVSNFSWELTATELLQVYENVYSALS